MSTYLLFDTDWVLIQSPMWSDEYSRRTWLDPHSMKPFFAWIFQECTIGRADLREVIVPFLEEWKWEWSPEEYLKAWFEFENQPDIELIWEIQKLRKNGIKCYIATNQEKYRLEYLKKEMHFENLFDGIFCSAEMGLKKPEKKYYQVIIDTLGVDPSDIIYFDDALENIESVRSLGIDARLYTRREDFTHIS